MIEPPNVRAQSQAVAAMSSDWPLVDALLGGTRGMRASGQSFLPQFPAEDDRDYKIRLSTAVLTNFFGRTCRVMAAKPFSRQLDTEKIAPSIAQYAPDIDGQGSNLQAFVGNVLTGCLSHGIGGILVDWPPVQGIRTRAEEKAAGVRPFWAHYPAATILGSILKCIGGEWQISQLRLLENVSEPDGDFAEKLVEQVRVLEPGLWQTWRKSDTDPNTWLLHEQGETSLDFVPFQFFYGVRSGPGVGVSPLIDLAYLNCEHWQSSSDQQTILHVARVPILFGKGMATGTELKIGASSAVIVPDETADLKFVEHHGHAISAGQQSILDLEDRMRQLGAELLIKQKGNTTATQVVSEGSANTCILQSIVENFEDGLNRCLSFTAQWLGEQDGGTVALYKDFAVDNLSDASAALLLDAAETNKISAQTFFEEMCRRSILKPDAKWDVELTQIAADAARAPKLPPDAPIPPVPIHPGNAD